MASRANTYMVGGTHYKGDGEEHWDRVARLELDYYQGNITKYIERARKKNGKADVQKALHYCQKYLELIEAGKIPGYNLKKGRNARTNRSPGKPGKRQAIRYGGRRAGARKR